MEKNIIKEISYSQHTAFNSLPLLHDRIFKDIKLIDLEKAIEASGKNFPVIRKQKVLLSQMYDYALRHDICNKNYSSLLDITKYKDRNPNQQRRTRFTRDEVDILWQHQSNPYVQIILMLIYNGVRISEFLALKKSDINWEEHTFNVIASKTATGIRKVPIADKVFPFYEEWAKRDCKYLLCTEVNRGFQYNNYKDAYFIPTLERLGMNHRPHDTRHTCESMLQDVDDPPISQTVIDKILGHIGNGASIGQVVYTHLDVSTILKAINRI